MRPRSWPLFLLTGVWLPTAKPSAAGPKTAAPKAARVGPGTFWNLRAPEPADPGPPPAARAPLWPTLSPADKVELELRALQAGLSLATGERWTPQAAPAPAAIATPPSPTRPSGPAVTGPVGLGPGSGSSSARPRPKNAGAPPKARAKDAPSPRSWAELASWWDGDEDNG